MKLSFDVGSTEEVRFCDPSLGSGCLTYREQPFESTCFQNRTVEILEWEVDDFPSLFSLFMCEKGFKHDDLIYLRLPANNIVGIRQAEAAGFYYIECSIIPFIRLRNWDQAKFERFIKPTESVTSDTISDVEEIAHSTFRSGRFNLDPHIGNDRADLRYLAWLRNAYENGEDIRILRHHDQVAGFSLLRFEGDRVVYRLACNRLDLKSTGLGMMLFASTMAYCKDQGIKHIDGGISMANLPVLNTMASLGFSFKDPTVVLHYYVD